MSLENNFFNKENNFFKISYVGKSCVRITCKATFFEVQLIKQHVIKTDVEKEKIWIVDASLHR